MGRYILKRLLLTVFVVVAVAVLIFTVLYFTPGDPATAILGPGATSEEKAEVLETLGLNEPYIVQLEKFMRQMFVDFDLGESWIYRTNITQEIATRLPRTAAIAIYSVLMSMILGIPLGILAAVRQDGIADKIVLFLSSFMRCIPNFWIGLMLVLLFALRLGWLPAYGINDGVKSYILPCITIMLGSFAWTSRQMRSSMLEVIRSDFVMSAKAQGYSKFRVYFAHALPNAIIPMITIMGTQFAHGLGGTIILETIFSIPGMGLYMQGAIGQRDLPAVRGVVVVLAVLFCLIMLLVDIAYACVDPRIKAQYAQKSVRKRAKKRGAAE